MADWIAAIILGLVEGLTEFIPVSSTGHLLLTQKLLGLTDPRWSSFVVLIQLGAILAVVALYFARLWKVLISLPTDPKARHFAISILIAFLPSVIVGVFLYDFIKAVLFNVEGDTAVTVICVVVVAEPVTAIVASSGRARSGSRLTFAGSPAGLIAALASYIFSKLLSGSSSE